jgi:hypothetical protein
MPKILFILKRKEDYNDVIDSAIGLTTGLYNSATFVKDMLNASGIESKLVVVIDNNDIDREVTAYQPTHVIIEALWVVPVKFEVLQKLHPNVKWIIRIHSEMPFMANEGIAMEWIADYTIYKNITIACNAPRMYNEVMLFLKHVNHWTDNEASEKVIYLPNYYPQDFKKTRKIDKKSDTINIGCFGAIRPLKNQLLQAHAAIMFAQNHNKRLRFHINASRIEMNGGPVYSNLIALFNQVASHGHTLICHPWMVRSEFLDLCSQMDIGLQVSFSETFNIVGADFVSQGVPFVGSSEIPWIDVCSAADPTSMHDILKKIEKAYKCPRVNVFFNRNGLDYYAKNVKRVWTKQFC